MEEVFGHQLAELHRAECLSFVETKESNEVNPIDKDYLKRMDLYQLYHYLNHLNLFGRMYLESVVEILNKYV